jgi:asparagine synthase (glutamine-hydrolysing)
MFAFALWDKRRRRLLLARDRMGEKPLYFYEREGQLIFASELKALMRSGLVPFELDHAAVDLYFHYHYVPEPETPITGVRKLAAAHTLTVEVDSWRTKQTCYWRMEDVPPLDGDPAELIRAELERVSEVIIRADVPVGVALSGGLDSSAVAALTSRRYPGTMHAFSVGYPGRPPSDERADAKALADHLGIPFHDVEIGCEEMVAFFPELVSLRDDPIADLSGHGYYAVMKLAREHGVPVILQGQGGDELFWGYPWVREAVVESLRKLDFHCTGHAKLKDYLELKLPQELSRMAIGYWVLTLAGLRTGWERYKRHKRAPVERLAFYDLVPDFQKASKDVSDIYTKTFMESFKTTGAFDIFTSTWPWRHVDIMITRLICQTYLQENGIVQGDRLSMASSVEMRLPLIDYRLVETVIGLRKMRPDYQLPPKAWFKGALNDVLPDWVMSRRKQGFSPSLIEWHRALFNAYGSLLDGGYLVDKRVLTPVGARNLSKGPFPKGLVVPLSFKALVLEVWCRQISSISREGTFKRKTGHLLKGAVNEATENHNPCDDGSTDSSA